MSKDTLMAGRADYLNTEGFKDLETYVVPGSIDYYGRTYVNQYEVALKIFPEVRGDFDCTIDEDGNFLMSAVHDGKKIEFRIKNTPAMDTYVEPRSNLEKARNLYNNISRLYTFGAVSSKYSNPGNFVNALIENGLDIKKLGSALRYIANIETSKEKSSDKDLWTEFGKVLEGRKSEPVKAVEPVKAAVEKQSSGRMQSGYAEVLKMGRKAQEPKVPAAEPSHQAAHAKNDHLSGNKADAESRFSHTCIIAATRNSSRAFL